MHTTIPLVLIVVSLVGLAASYLILAGKGDTRRDD
jgi:F0F1-type ATP synthase assembly protein I